MKSWGWGLAIMLILVAIALTAYHAYSVPNVALLLVFEAVCFIGACAGLLITKNQENEKRWQKPKDTVVPMSQPVKPATTTDDDDE